MKKNQRRGPEKVVMKEVEGDILEIIVEYLKYHKGTVPKEIGEWDMEFINRLDMETVYGVMKASGRWVMDIASLVDLSKWRIGHFEKESIILVSKEKVNPRKFKISKPCLRLSTLLKTDNAKSYLPSFATPSFS